MTTLKAVFVIVLLTACGLVITVIDKKNAEIAELEKQLPVRGADEISVENARKIRFQDVLFNKDGRPERMLCTRLSHGKDNQYILDAVGPDFANGSLKVELPPQPQR